MKRKQGNLLQSLRGVQGFLGDHADRLGAVAGSGARKTLDRQMEELNVHVETQAASDLQAQGATQLQRALRRVLVYEHMLPIVRIAAAEWTATPEFMPFRMPSGKASTEIVHAAAMGMADAVEKHAEVFVAAGLPGDFVAQLREAADAMRLSVDARRQRWGDRHGATEGLATGLSSARRTVRVLDALVRVAVKGDVALLAAWDSVKRLPRQAGKGVAMPDVVATAEVAVTPEASVSAANEADVAPPADGVRRLRLVAA